MSDSADTVAASPAAVEEHVRRLEARVDTLAEAIEVLARGLEDRPIAEPQDGLAGHAARQARELLLLSRSQPGNRDTDER